MNSRYTLYNIYFHMFYSAPDDVVLFGLVDGV